MVDSENDKVYCLYAMREFRKDDYFRLYMCEREDYDTNSREEYVCNRLKADRYKVCIGYALY